MNLGEAAGGGCLAFIGQRKSRNVRREIRFVGEYMLLREQEPEGEDEY